MPNQKRRRNDEDKKDTSGDGTLISVLGPKKLEVPKFLTILVQYIRRCRKCMKIKSSRTQPN